MNNDHQIKSKDWQPRILAFLCNWCSYAGADLAGVSRLQYPPNVRIVRVPCSGRVNPAYILKALQNGVDGVLVSGCHPGDCHYLTGNYHARRKFHLLKELLDFVGVEDGRVQFSWVSAAEGAKFSQVMTEVTEKVRALGPNRCLAKQGRGDDGYAGWDEPVWKSSAHEGVEKPDAIKRVPPY